MGYRLMGDSYQEIPLTPSGKRWSEQLQLFLGVEHQKLCYFTPEEELILSPDQLVRREQQRSIQAEQEAKQAQQQANRLAAYLRSLNIDPDTIP